MNKGLTTSINPFSKRAIAKGSRHYNDILKTGVFNLSVPIITELRDLEPMEIDGKGTLRILLRDGDYKMAFEYLFLMGKSMEMDIVAKLLDALIGYRLSFYHLDDHRIDTYVVYNRMRVPLSKLLLSPQGNFRVFIGSFSEDEIREAVRDTIIHQSRALDDKCA